VNKCTSCLYSIQAVQCLAEGRSLATLSHCRSSLCQQRRMSNDKRRTANADGHWSLVIGHIDAPTTTTSFVFRRSPFVPLVVRSFDRSIGRSFVRSFVRSFYRSFDAFLGVPVCLACWNHVVKISTMWVVCEQVETIESGIWLHVGGADLSVAGCDAIRSSLRRFKRYCGRLPWSSTATVSSTTNMHNVR